MRPGTRNRRTSSSSPSADRSKTGSLFYHMNGIQSYQFDALAVQRILRRDMRDGSGRR